MKYSYKLSCDLFRCPDTSFLKLIPNHRGTKMAVVVGGAGEGGGRFAAVKGGAYEANYVSLEWVITFGKFIIDIKN